MGTFHKRNRLLAKELREANLANNNNNNNNDQESSYSLSKGRTSVSKTNTLLQQQQQPIKSSEILIALVRKSILFTIFIGIISIKNNYYFYEHMLLPNGNIDFTVPLLYNFLPPIKNNTLLQFQHDHTSIIMEKVNNTTNTNNNSTSSLLLLYGSETIIINQYTDQIYIVNPNGYLVHVVVPTENNNIVMTATRTTIIANLGNGRPLSGQFTLDTSTNTITLYITDAILGILRIRNFHHDYTYTSSTRSTNTGTNTGTTTPKLVVEIVVSKDTYNQQSINFADDIIIESKSGIVYFTDATTIPPPRRSSSSRRLHHHNNKHSNINNKQQQQKYYTWDLLYPTIQECLRNSGSGRLLQYNPITDITTVLMTNLSFANGVSFIKSNNNNNKDSNEEEELSILVVETCRMQIHEYYLNGPKQGTSTIVVHMNQLPGFPDGIDCFVSSSSSNKKDTTTTSTNKCYIAIMNEVNIVQKLFQLLPSSIEPYIRILALWATQYISLPIRPYGGLVEINVNTQQRGQQDDTSTGSSNNNNNRVSIERYLIDPIGRDISGITGVTHYKDKLYLGSLHNPYMGIYHLQSTSSST